MPTSNKRRFILLSLLVCCFGLIAHAQRNMTDIEPNVMVVPIPTTSSSAADSSTPSALSPGVSPLGSYGGSSFDKVNLFNGGLSFSIPLTSLNGRAGLGVALSLSYNSKIWRTETVSGNAFGPCFEPVYNNIDQGLPELAPGWRISAGRLIARQTAYGTTKSCGTSKAMLFTTTLTTVTFTVPDGTEYDFRDDLYDGQPLGPVNCQGASRGNTFHSTDGTSAIFISQDSNGVPVPILDNPSPGSGSGQIYPSGVVILRDGTKFFISSGRVRKQEDRNGNIVRFSYDTSSQLIRVVDTLGRTISISYPSTNNAPSTVAAQITFNGVNGALRTITINSDQLVNALRADQPPQPTLVGDGGLFPEADFQCGFSAVNPPPFNPTIVSSIDLPGGYNWQFQYNSYAEVASVKTPSGGVVEYDTDGPQGVPGVHDGVRAVCGTLQIFRRVAARRTKADGFNVESTTGYGDPTLPPDPNQPPLCGTIQGEQPGPLVTETEYDGNSGILTLTKHQFFGTPLDNYGKDFGAPPKTGYRPWMEGKEIQTTEFDRGGALLRTTSYTFEQAGDVGWAFQATGNTLLEPENNPRLKVSATALDNGPASTVQNDYDSYNNLISERVYDYGQSTATPPLRRIDRTYIAVNPINGVDYRQSTIHIVSLVNTETVSGPKSAESTTEFEYDNGGLVNEPFSAQDLDPMKGNRDPGYGGGYTTRGNATAVTRGFGSVNHSTISTAYDIAGSVVSTSGPRTDLNQSTSISYDPLFHFAYPTKIVNALGLTASRSYDLSTGALLSVTGFNGETTGYTYADPFSLDRLTQETRPSGLGNTLYSYSGPGQGISVTTQTQLQGSVYLMSTVIFDGFLKPTLKTRSDPSGMVTVETHYDGLGRAIEISNPFRGGERDSDGWTFTQYDGLGRVTRVSSFADSKHSIDFSGSVTSSYSGNSVTVTDQAGKVRKSISDALGRITEVDEPNPLNSPAIPTLYQYDGRGNLLTVLQGQQTRTFTYDALSRLTLAQLPESGTTSYDSYDEASNLKSRTAGGVNTTFSYDALNRILTKQYSDGTPMVQYSYDQGSNGLGRLTRVASGGAGTTYSYDIGGRITNNTQQLDGQSYSVATTYNEGSLPTSETYPSGRTITNSYNSAGQAASISMGNQTIAANISYTASGALTQQQLGNGLAHKIAYNDRLQPTAISLGGGNDATVPLYRYDNPNNGFHFYTTNFSELGNGGAGYTLEGIQGYVYVLANQAPGTVPLYRYGNTTNGSHLYTTNFSELGNGGSGYVLEGVQCYVFPTQASGTVPLYRYLNTINGDHFYTTSFSELGNGAFGYTFEGIQCYVYPGPQGVNDSLIYSYGSGNNGNVLGVVINRSGKLFNQLYQYDELNRVISAKELSGGAINWTQTFKYDQYGNQSCCAPSPGPGTQPGQNIATIDPITNRIMDNGYGYDGAGNLTKLPNGTIYSYDGENRMKSATIGGISASFIYDGNGERVKKIGSATSRYIYDSQGRLIAEYTGNAVAAKTPSKEYVYGPSGLLAIIDYSTAPATTKYITPDALGSTRLVTGNNGNLISRHDWFAFGAEIDNSLGGRAAITGYGSADNVNQKFTGYERDLETGLDFAKARYYSSAFGRFNSVDPLGKSARLKNPQTWNRYTYVLNNPLRFTDPTGLDGENPSQALELDLGVLATEGVGIEFIGAAGAYGVPVIAVGFTVYIYVEEPSILEQFGQSGLHRDEFGVSETNLNIQLMNKANDPNNADADPVKNTEDEGKVKHFEDFDKARRDAFEQAGMTDPDKVTPTKEDPKTGTYVEFKGEKGAKVAYDSPHADADPEAGHDKPHVGYQSGGKRGQGGAQRGNNTYDGPQHPSRPNVKGAGDIKDE